MTRFLTCFLAVLCLGACAGVPPAQETPLRVFYLSQSVGFVHETVRRPASGLSSSELALQEMARDSGAFTIELSQDARDLTADRLTGFDVLVFSTTGALPIDQTTWATITDWIESGRGGFIGIHSAADTALHFEGGEEAYTAFLGGRFDGHPWTQGTPIRLSNLEPSHPLAAPWPHGTPYAEEIYQYACFVPERVRVLQTLDMSAGEIRRPYPVPVTWVREIGKGRLFYTNLGHTPSTWSDPRFRRQIIDAIRWSGHRLDASATPNPEVQNVAALTAFAATEGVSARPGTEDAIRGLQALHPEKQGGETSAWHAARRRIREATDE